MAYFRHKFPRPFNGNRPHRKLKQFVLLFIIPSFGEYSWIDQSPAMSIIGFSLKIKNELFS